MVSLITSSQMAESPLTASSAMSSRPKLVRKRSDQADNISSSDLTPRSPSKKARVSFDEKIEVRFMDSGEKPLETVRQEVRWALDRHAKGDDVLYAQILEIYTTQPEAEDAASTTTLRTYTSALLSQVSRLHHSYSKLVHAVLASQWLGRTETYVTLFSRFLGSLVSAQGSYLGDVLRMLVDNLQYAPPSSGKLPNHCMILKSQLYSRVHSTLHYILQLVPSASSMLSSVLVNCFPDPTASRRTYTVYTSNVLEIISYAPELRSDILNLITERLVKIDVQVQEDILDLAEDVGEGLVHDISRVGPMNDLDDESDSEDDSDEGESDVFDAEAERTKVITRNVVKMDCMLDMLFAHYAKSFPKSTSISAATTDDAFNAFDVILGQFTSTILPTYRSRHTQFLLFHYAQTSYELMDLFCGACIQIIFDKTRPSLVRQSAAAYLASFVARAAHVPAHTVVDVFEYLSTQLKVLRVDYEPQCRGPDLQRYPIYYALMQALLYIFCFRWRDLEIRNSDNDGLSFDGYEERGERNWIDGLKKTFEQNVYSRLNPLKICAPIIVSEFARIANHLQVVYIFHIIETNKRINLAASHFSLPPSAVPSSSQSLASSPAYGNTFCKGGLGKEWQQRQTALSVRKDDGYKILDGYFPFDPYYLPRSKKWVEGDYREWKGIKGLDPVVRVEEEESNDESEEGSESNMDEET